ncbi:ester cyclase [cf. Phormidesmis sp. LEGE 11477]|uniref:ester cyclase n=1 Tax=cf. Phormidesmis sp. LEGE 11477 TaxID=1828680 RepID=UPI001881918F|nr:ester cyclase [cf. Phormidesmis sp. LEGE 11477]MBE9061910.1 ester cyclase [cf. Phormidesmis sp. LEGE 11477]
MSVEQNKAIALRFMNQGWGTCLGWQTVWDELMTPDVTYHFNSEPEPIVGLGDNKIFNSALFEGFPNIEHTLESVVAEDDKVVYRTVLRGTHTGEFLGIPPTGKVAEISDFTMLKITGGRISEWWYDCNLLALMKQLGVIS